MCLELNSTTWNSRRWLARLPFVLGPPYPRAFPCALCAIPIPPPSLPSTARTPTLPTRIGPLGRSSSQPTRTSLPKMVHHNCYNRRDAALKAIGFETYKVYLGSDLWKGIKSAVMSRDKGRCVLCGRDGYTAHHITYGAEVLLSKDLTQLICICRGCHKRIEFDRGSKLTSAKAVSKKLFDSIRGNGFRKKHVKSRHSPKCVVCGQPAKHLGRDDICMPCYRSGRVTEWRRETTTPIDPPPNDAGRTNTVSQGTDASAAQRTEPECTLPDTRPAEPRHPGV